MLLPRGEPLLENTKVRFVDLDVFLADDFESSLKKTEKNTGYVSLSYARHKDFLLIFEGQIQCAIRTTLRDGRTVIGVEEVITSSKDDPEGVVNFFRMPVTFLEMFRHATTEPPLHDSLSTSFILWDRYVTALQKSSFEGYIECNTRGMIGYLRFEQGLPTTSFSYQPIDYQTEKSIIRLFSPPPPYFIPEVERIKLSFLDIFKDMLQTTFSILVQTEQVNAVLSKTLGLARKQYPVLLKEVHTRKAGLIDIDQMLVNLDVVAPGEKRDTFIGCLIEVLYQRLVSIRELFGDTVLERTLKELKLVQIYHQPSLRRFQVGDSLLALWKRFE